jgi:hypothetical protein
MRAGNDGSMTMTTVLILNAILSGGVFVALGLVFRLAHRLPQMRLPETLHPSQPIPLRLALVHTQGEDLPRAA